MVKRFLNPPHGIHTDTWITPPSQRASAQSRVLLIPSLDETIGHWFLVALINVDTGQKRALIFDLLKLEAGKRRIPAIRMLLRKLTLIAKRDKCETMPTQKQSERECGPRMVMYMLTIGKP